MTFGEMTKHTEFQYWMRVFESALRGVSTVNVVVQTVHGASFDKSRAHASVSAAEYIADLALERITLKQKELLDNVR